MNTSINIDLGDRSYKISIGHDLLKSVSGLVPEAFRSRSVFIISDENVAGHFETPFIMALEDAGYERINSLVLPPGEQTKSFKHLEQVVSWLLNHRADRKSLVIALGGGVIGDLAGFAASIFLRGVPYLHVPTTLLAQIDSSIGGKTAINMPQGKNLVGSFFQPVAVIADVDTLKTLPRRELLSGYAEGVKHAVIADKGFFEWLTENHEQVLAFEPEYMERFVEWNCRIKAAVVQADEKENGSRALLNLGHTFGHALEAVCGYDSSLLHGEAVAIGMVLAMTLSEKMGYCPADDVVALKQHLEQVGLPRSIRQIDPPIAAGAVSLAERMKGDKKSVSGKISFVLSRGIGEAFSCADVQQDDVIAVLQDSIDGVI